jgi:hypothetical protein
MVEIENWVKASRKESQKRELYIVKKYPQDIDSIVNKAIEGTKGKEYNLSTGNQAKRKVTGRRFNGTF